MSEIKLDGGEISLLKAIGTSGAPLPGQLLLDRIGEIAPAEFLDALSGLLDQEYVLASKVNVRTVEDVERSFFRVNPAYTKELREAMNPARRRREERERRQRRS